jgi:hypothetical protein
MKYYPCVHARALRRQVTNTWTSRRVVYRGNPSSKFHVAGKLDGASKGRTARYNLHSNSRASRTMMTDRGGDNPFGRRGGLCFRTERSLAEHARLRRASADATIETHSDMLIRSENCETTIPAPGRLALPRRGRSCSCNFHRGQNFAKLSASEARQLCYKHARARAHEPFARRARGTI